MAKRPKAIDPESTTRTVQFEGYESVLPLLGEWRVWFRSVGIDPDDVTVTGFVSVEGNVINYESFVKQNGHFVKTADGKDVARTIRGVVLDHEPPPFPGDA